MNDNPVVRVFLLVIGNALALVLGCLAVMTTRTNFLGWFLLAVAIGYGAGGVFYLWHTRQEEHVVRSETGDRSFWWIVPGFLAVFFSPPLEYLYLPPTLPRGEAIELAGLFVILVGLSLRIWTRFALRGQYSGYLRVRVGHRLVMEGPYRFVRHPGYLGFLFMSLGLALGYASLIGLLSVPFLLLPGLVYRLNVEERLLIEEFGDEYHRYAQTSRKLVPWLW